MLVAALVFGALAAMMMFRGWDHFVAPLAEKAAADRTAWSNEPFQISSLGPMELPDVGPRSDSSAWLEVHAKLADEMKSSNMWPVTSLRPCSLGGLDCAADLSFCFIP